MVGLSSCEQTSSSGNIVWILKDREFDGGQSTSYKWGGEIFMGENDNASEEDILGTGIATSTTLPLLVLSLATILLNLLVSQFYNSSTS